MRYKQGLLLMLLAVGIVIGFYYNIFQWINISIWSIVFAFFALKGLWDSSWLITSLFSSLLINLYNEQYHFIPFGFWVTFLVTSLFFYGLFLIFPKERKKFTNKVKTKNVEFTSNSAIFGDAVRYVDEKNLKEFNVKTLFGDNTIYFDNADVEDGKAVFKIDIVFGDTTIYVPNDWEIINELQVIFGDYRHHKSRTTETKKKIYLRGTVLFGDLKVIQS